MRSTRRPVRPFAVLAVGLLAGLGVAGCSTSSSSAAAGRTDDGDVRELATLIRRVTP